MYFANPWGLIGLAALPAIVLIHMYHRRFPPLVVAGSHLWSPETKQNLAGRRRETLPVTASLLLELLAALLLSVVLAEPHFGDIDKAVHLVAVLDNSASMQGRPPEKDEPSFRDAAIAELERRIARSPRGSVVTLILTGDRPEMLAGPAVSWDEAKARLADWRPSAPRHAFEPAWDLGLQLVEQQGELLFITDRLPAEKDTPHKMEVVSVGLALDNVAIGAARWVFDSSTGKGRVFLRVQNHGRKPARIEVRGRKAPQENVRQAGQEIFRKAVALDPGAATSLEAEVKGGTQELLVSLDAPGDGLALDNRVQLVEPKVRAVTVANTLPKGEASRLLTGVLRALPDVQFVDPAAATLLFAPAAKLPPSNPGLWWLGIGPVSTAQADLKQASDLSGPYLLEKRNPLLEGLVLGGVIWGGVQPVTLNVTPLISAGRHPLLARLNGTQTTAWLLNIDLARSNLGESPDWPILLSNLVELRRNDLPGLQRWNYRLGEDVRFRLFEGDAPESAAAAPLALVREKQVKPLIRAAIVEIPAPDQIGIYEVRERQSSLGRFAVNFEDAEESDLRRLAPGRRAAVANDTSSEIALDNPYSWVAMALIALIVATAFCDWIVLRGPGRS